MVFQREYGKNVDLNMSESSVDRSIVPEYSELLEFDENSKTTAEAKTLNNNSNSITISINNNTNNNNNNNSCSSSIINNNNNSNITTANLTTNNENPVQIGDVEMTSVEISTQPAILPQSVPSVKAIEKQIETRRADGKRRITAMFVPFSVDQDG